MKAAIIAGCVVLSVLNAPGAHAINLSMWVCPGGRTVTSEVVKDERWRTTGEAGESITISGIDGEGLHGKSDSLRVRFTKKGTYLNGKRCQSCWYSDCSKDRWKHCRENNDEASCKP
jgi:hypothetical protein